jgi:uncharacterized protein YndB with AHSA1/START domain
MRTGRCIALLVIAFAPAAARGGETPAALPAAFDEGHVHVTVSTQPKRLDWDVVVPAPPSAVWDAFTTASGMETWIAPKATVELRRGGVWSVGFPGAAPGGGTIALVQPQTLLAVDAMAPEQFPEVRRERTLAVFTFSPAQSGTLVHLSQTGWRSGDEWDHAFAYLARGNAELLEALYVRFAKGPIDWSSTH